MAVNWDQSSVYGQQVNWHFAAYSVIVPVNTVQVILIHFDWLASWLRDGKLVFDVVPLDLVYHEACG